MNEIQIKLRKKSKLIKIEILLISFILVIPSIVFYAKNKSILPYEGGWTFLMENTLQLDATTRTYFIFNCIYFISCDLFSYFKKGKQTISNSKGDVWLNFDGFFCVYADGSV